MVLREFKGKKIERKIVMKEKPKLANLHVRKRGRKSRRKEKK